MVSLASAAVVYTCLTEATFDDNIVLPLMSYSKGFIDVLRNYLLASMLV